MHSNNRNKKNVPTTISCCSSQSVHESNHFDARLGCPTQCPCCCHKVTSTPNACNSCKSNAEEALCPMLNTQEPMAQKRTLVCSDICNDCNEEQMQLLPQVVKCGSSNSIIIEKRTNVDPLENMDCSRQYEPAISNASSTLPLQKKICDLCCSEKERKVAKKISVSLSPPHYDDIESPTVAAKTSEKPNSRQFQEEGKQSLQTCPMSSPASSTPKRTGSSIASEINQTMTAAMLKKIKSEKIDKKNKKKKNSNTSIRSNTNTSETCSCKEDKVAEDDCTCHFPPAFSEFFHCTGDITGTCNCSKNK